MTEITLPWPLKDLSPNSRIHWRRLATAKKVYRHECCITTLQQVNSSLPDGPLRLELEFIKPSRREMDRDNLLARMKSGLDGVCDALKIDDKRFATVVVRVAPDRIGGYVKLKITGENDG
jgi:crossover junction endodeoxyribonuclease RusA